MWVVFGSFGRVIVRQDAYFLHLWCFRMLEIDGIFELTIVLRYCCCYIDALEAWVISIANLWK
jgi:hypothetical protein